MPQRSALVPQPSKSTRRGDTVRACCDGAGDSCCDLFGCVLLKTDPGSSLRDGSLGPLGRLGLPSIYMPEALLHVAVGRSQRSAPHERATPRWMDGPAPRGAMQQKRGFERFGLPTLRDVSICAALPRARRFRMQGGAYITVLYVTHDEDGKNGEITRGTYSNGRCNSAMQFSRPILPPTSALPATRQVSLRS